MNQQQFATKIVNFVEFSYVQSLEWSAGQGQLLRYRRDDKRVADILRVMLENGFKYNQDSILNLEKGKLKSITPKVLQALCQSLEINIDQFYPIIGISDRTANLMYQEKQAEYRRLYLESQLKCD